jgi:hypothetical protein
MKKANIVLLPVYLLLTSFRKIRIGCKKGKDRLRGDGLKVSNVYLDIGYYSLSTSSVTFKNKFGIKKRVWLICFSRFNLLISSFIGVRPINTFVIISHKKFVSLLNL